FGRLNRKSWKLKTTTPTPVGVRRGGKGSVRARSVSEDQSLLLGREQAVNLGVRQVLDAVVGVDHQGGAVGRHPHQVVAELEHFLDLRVPLEYAEVGVAHGADGDGLHLGVEADVDPDAADFHDVAAGDVPLSGGLQARLVAERVVLHGELDAGLAGL